MAILTGAAVLLIPLTTGRITPLQAPAIAPQVVVVVGAVVVVLEAVADAVAHKITAILL